MRNIFITGGTGFLGSMLIREILASSDDAVYALIRDKSKEEATDRLVSNLEATMFPKKLTKKQLDRITIVKGDITKKDFGLETEAIVMLAKHIDVIFNSAALTSLTSPLEMARKVNLEGTRNVLDFAMFCMKNGKLTKVNHISTAYIAGKIKSCCFREINLSLGQEFNNAYEQSKFEAEQLVVEYRKKGLDINIYRPSIILGSYEDGRTTNFKMFYQPLHYFSLELFTSIPAANNSRANLINVDVAAEAIYLISNLSREKNANYNIVSPKTPELEFVLDIASDYFGYKMPRLIPLQDFDLEKAYTPVQRNLIEPFIPYFNYYVDFDMGNAMSILMSQNFVFPEFDETNFLKLYEFCDMCGFIKRKKRNVAVK